MSGEESLLAFLEKMGAKLYQGHNTYSISQDVDYVVVSYSIEQKNVELLEA